MLKDWIKINKQLTYILYVKETPVESIIKVLPDVYVSRHLEKITSRLKRNSQEMFSVFKENFQILILW